MKKRKVKRRQIINPGVRFGPSAKGPYATRVASAKYAKPTRRRDTEPGETRVLSDADPRILESGETRVLK